jgi:hypothetical protein
MNEFTDPRNTIDTHDHVIDYIQKLERRVNQPSMNLYLVTYFNAKSYLVVARNERRAKEQHPLYTSLTDAHIQCKQVGYAYGTNPQEEVIDLP